ncbi:hypothetical protein PI125_g12589 [Phytophthora idaei]|nr:hypothetical protein PI125_g12589 [Phytophthora idaei]
MVVSSSRPPPPLERHDDLIDEDHVCVLEDAAPWDVLTTLADPLTFEDGGWFATYSTYEDEYHRAHWDSTHAFPISIAKRHQSRYPSGFYTNRKQRRSRAGARWKVFLQLVLEGMRRGLCDLDQLLDPFFLHYPQRGSWSLVSRPRGRDRPCRPSGGFGDYRQRGSLAQSLPRSGPRV